MNWSVVRPQRFRYATAIALIESALFAYAVDASETDFWSHSATVSIRITNYRFTPEHFALEHGKPYRLHLENTSARHHSCGAPDLFASSTIASADRAKIDAGAIDVDPNSNADVLLVPLASGDYAFVCTHFLHTRSGMRGVAAVN